MRLPEKFKFLETLQAFHADVLSQTRFISFHKLNVTEFLTSNENLDDLEKHYMNNSLCDWTNLGIHLFKDQGNCWCNVYNFQNAPCTVRVASQLWQNQSQISYACIPISNVCVERVFSQDVLAKTKVRNKMGHKLLKSILLIRSHLMLNNSCCNDFVVS